MINISNKIKVAYLKLIQHPLQGFYLRKKARLPIDDILLPDSYYELGLVAIFRGEDDYLIEWIEFHKLMGVDHFIMYDNGCSQKSHKLLKKYIDSGFLTYIPFPHIQGSRDGRKANTISTQQVAYADCIKRFKKHFKYLLQLDIDEFLFPKHTNSITELLDQLSNKISRIDVNWTNFGSNGHIKKPKGLVTENYTRSSKTLDLDGLKSIVNTEYLSKFFKYSNVHRFSIKYSIKDKIKKIIYKYPKVLKGAEANKLFQLNHYITKSKEEYLKKGKIYSNGWQVGKKTEARFDQHNNKFNAIENKNIKRFIPELTKVCLRYKNSINY